MEMQWIAVSVGLGNSTARTDLQNNNDDSNPKKNAKKDRFLRGGFLSMNKPSGHEDIKS